MVKRFVIIYIGITASGYTVFKQRCNNNVVCVSNRPYIEQILIVCMLKFPVDLWHNAIIPLCITSCVHTHTHTHLASAVVTGAADSNEDNRVIIIGSAVGAVVGLVMVGGAVIAISILIAVCIVHLSKKREKNVSPE